MMLAVNLELTAEQRLEKAVVQIMSHPRYVAMAGVMMIGERYVVRNDPNVPTASTNGRDEWYSAEFIDMLTDPMLRYLVLHECKHKLYKHLTTYDYLHQKDAQCANMSADHVINNEIDEENPDGFCVMPAKSDGTPIGLCDKRFNGWSTKQVFDVLYEELKDGGGQGNGDGEGEGGMDSHDWAGAKELTEAEKRELERDIEQAIQQGALTASKTGADMPRSFEELLHAQVDWREVMRDFVTDVCTGKDYSTYARPNRRYMAAGLYMPSALAETVGELVVAVDTSGSIGNRQLSAFLSELVSICETVNPSAVRLLYWGHKIAGDETYGGDSDKSLDDIVSSTKPVGGGGTDVNCVCEYIAEQSINAEAVVVLTDGYLAGDWGTWNTPVLWCVLNNKSANPSVGQTVHIDDI